MNGIATPTALDALREATTAVHLRLHALPDFDGIADGTMTRARYGALLAKLYGFHASLDDAFRAKAAALAADGIDVGGRARIDALEDDLRTLGIDPAALARWRVPDAPRSVAAWAGWLYVREGSTLGARVIARQLDALFGDASAGRRFFAGDGAEGARWKRTCAMLEHVAAEDEHAIDDMTRGAVAAFAAFEDWMR